MNSPHDLQQSNDRIRLIVREEVAALIAEHRTTCPLTAENIPKRIRDIEVAHAKLIGLLAGSAALGGGVGSLIAKLI